MKHIKVVQYSDEEFFSELISNIVPSIEDMIHKKLDELKPVRYLTVYETAEKLSCSKSALYNKVNKGEINLYKNGKRSVFIESELEQYILTNKSN